MSEPAAQEQRAETRDDERSSRTRVRLAGTHPAPADEQRPTLAAVTRTAPIEGGFVDYLRNYWQRIRAGDLGSLPAVAGLVLLVIIFSVAQSSFWSLGNFANVITQAAPSVLLAMGLVFVLLLGEIDLSAGSASGVAGAVTAVLIYNGMNWVPAVIVALAVGVIIGYFIGFMRAIVQVPSFVVTLALLLALQGVVLWVVTSVHASGNIPLKSSVLNALENSNMPIWLGWFLGALCVAGYLAVKIADRETRRRRDLPTEPLAITAAKAAAMAVFILLPIAFLSADRALIKEPTVETVNGQLVQVPHKPLEGVPWVVPLVVALVVLLGFVLTRTRYGRHIYAVGGNDEAARRAGIRVEGIRISVFIISSLMAVISGIVLASRISVNAGQGGGNTLLLAVGAAVIGGTSLFGGKGKITDAVIGGMVVAVITNGMSDLIQGDNSQAIQFIVTGGVLALAATVDALSRKRAGSTGV
jgi:D-xylose transport system permease protein